MKYSILMCHSLRGNTIVSCNASYDTLYKQLFDDHLSIAYVAPSPAKHLKRHFTDKTEIERFYLNFEKILKKLQFSGGFLRVNMGRNMC